jgi:hypothetical protein
MKVKTFVSLVAGVMFFSVSVSQNMIGSFSATGAGYSSTVLTDYQTVGLNPANLGWKHNSHLINFGIAETGFTVYSEPLKRSLVKELWGSNENQLNTLEEKDEAAELFSNTRLEVQGSVDGIGLSFQDEKIGGFAITAKEKLYWNSKLGDMVADIIFKGYNADYFDSLAVSPEGDTVGWATVPALLSDLIENTRISLQWYREYNLSYGRSIINKENISIYAGVGFKYLEGYNMFKFGYEEGNEYIAAAALNPAVGIAFGPTPSAVEGNKYQAIGHGWGLDFGISAFLFKQLRIAASLIDYGSITWDGNVYTVSNDFVKNITDEGLNSYSIFDLQNTGSFDNLKWGGWEGAESYTTDLPMNMRFGASYILKNKYEFGTDVYVPMNKTAPGAYTNTMFGLGTRLMPVKWMRFSAGFVYGGETGYAIPAGISFFPFNNSSFMWELGFAIRDVATYFDQTKPTVSVALGLLRFSFGNLSKKSAGSETENAGG